MDGISSKLHGFQSALTQSGSSLREYIIKNYKTKWQSEYLLRVLKIRTCLVNTIQRELAKKGLVNIERVQMSPVTDPLAHDVEEVPTVYYKGYPYRLTHSMIYAKFLACFNGLMRGIFVDSNNIRLEIQSADNQQRGRYLAGFSQIDIEYRRQNIITLDEYLHDQDIVKGKLIAERDDALNFFEDLIIAAMKAILSDCGDDLDYLGVQIEVPTKPFPHFLDDEVKKLSGEHNLKFDGLFAWILGLLRENYDLVYPFILPSGKIINRNDINSGMIYNYDLVCKSADTNGGYTPPIEISSGAVREWIYEAIIARLIANKIIKTEPVFDGDNITNISELDGYGPFLMMAKEPDFPATAGGGIGVERTLYALLRASKYVNIIDDVTNFGQNPDSHSVYLF